MLNKSKIGGIMYFYCIYILLVLLVGNLILFYYGMRIYRKRKKEIQCNENRLQGMLKKIEYNEEIIAAYKISNIEVLNGYVRMVQLSISPRKNKYKTFLLEYNKIMYNLDEAFFFNWEIFCHLLNNAYNKYLDRLYADYSYLSDKEVYVIAMQKAGFEIAEIAEISGYSINTIYKRNSDIRRKMEIPESGNIIEFIDERFS